MNPYTILGVSPDDDIDKIRKSFYKLAHQFHPDKGGDLEKMKKIGGAWAWIRDHHGEKVETYWEETTMKIYGSEMGINEIMKILDLEFESTMDMYDGGNRNIF